MSTRARILLSAAIILLALAAFVWWLSVRYRTTPVTPVALPNTNEAPAENVNRAAPTTTPTPSANANNNVSSAATPAPTPPATNTAEPSATAPPQSLPPSASGLLIPVVGVRPEQLRDTYNEARSEGRVHDAIDIMAACGTPVVAAADGLIVKLFQSERGGTTIYQRSTDDKLIYYYAHLKAYADGLTENKTVRRGETIAYVGDTGNAGPGNCHLHFAIWLITDPKHYWDGQNINPYPLLRGQRSEVRGQ
ncbi:MAG: endopeptidase [Acidobacteria bacterium]|nr:MAG: endopeptidase [Acidobacteriota bacterium]